MSDATILGSRRVHDGRVVRLDLEKVRLPNGNEVTLEIVRHPGAAAVVPVDGDGHAILVRQYRHATGSWVLEVPAGKLDQPGESPEECARREVLEETGYRAGSLQPLGWIWTTPGFSDEKIWLFLARELERAEASPQEDEVLTVLRLPLEDAVRSALDGEIQDAKSVCALLRASSAVR